MSCRILTISSLLLAFAATALLFAVPGCTFRRITVTKDVVYRDANPTTGTGQQELSVFAPRKVADLTNVFVFIHGGSWKSGRKELYRFLGKRMARRGVTTVIIDYPLSPAAQYNEMATSAARAVQWVRQHIRNYGGSPDSIFVAGHSAGGHLAALLTVRDAYFDTLSMANPIRGAILIDAAGLDMYGYLMEKKPEERKYLSTFTTHPRVWKEASPLYYLHPDIPPMLIYRGGKTYPSIIESNDKFAKALEKYVAKPDYRIQKGKKHIPMILQFLYGGNPRYKEIIHFMEAPPPTPDLP